MRIRRIWFAVTGFLGMLQLACRGGPEGLTTASLSLNVAATNAEATLYAADDIGQLWTVDVPTAASILVGPTSFPRVTDIALSPTGLLFGTTGTDLILVDAQTGVGSLIGSHGPLDGIVVGLDFAADGTLFGTIQGNGAVVTIETSTGAATIATPIPFSAIGDVTVSSDGSLLGTFFPNHLVRIDLPSGVVTVIGEAAAMSTLDLDPSSGKLIGIANGVENVVSVEPETGATTFVSGPIPFRNFGGTFATVHTPITPQDQIRSLIDAIEDLASQQALSEDQAAGLVEKLEAAIIKVDQDQIIPAVKQLEAFIQQMRGLISAHQIPLERGQPLLDEAQAVIERLLEA